MIAEIIAGYAAVVATASVIFQLWQARSARRPQIELELIHTQMTLIPKDAASSRLRIPPKEAVPYLTVFLEVRNRGNQPIRIVGAGIDTPKVIFYFRSEYIEIAKSGIRFPIRNKIDSVNDKAEMPPLPGIILPGDAASRSVSNLLIPDQDIPKIRKALRAELEDEIDDFFKDVASSVREELYGWVEISTGEFMHTKHVKYDWDAALDQSRIGASASGGRQWLARLMNLGRR